MIPQVRHSFRVVVRLLWLAAELAFGLMRFAALLAIHCGIPDRGERARWLQRICRRTLRIFHLQLRVAGAVPSQGLLVCNHLSYLDILVLAAPTPSVFIAKCEVKRWPVFGWFASMAGTLFLHRENRLDVARVTREMGRVLDEGALVVLFPEGTSSDGSKVLPFKSSLLEPAIGQRYALSAAFVEYGLSYGDVAEEVCYWKDMTLLPHLLNLFSKRGLTVRLRFSELRLARGDRKQLARQLYSEVVRLKTALSI